jgi:hypothetical protein
MLGGDRPDAADVRGPRLRRAKPHRQPRGRPPHCDRRRPARRAALTAPLARA